VTDPPPVVEPPVPRSSVSQLRSLLARYDAEEVAAVEARVRAACITARPADAEERALAITLDVLRFRHRSRPGTWSWSSR
jgi:hypothetical protein